MRILYYNWVAFDSRGKYGGGVSVYQKNLIDALKDREEIFFLSSGQAYDLKNTPYIKKTKNCFGEKCHSFEIVNSPIMSPASKAFFSIAEYLNDDILYNLFVAFLREYGPFDVVHFNNMEGLSINVLKIKEVFPATRIVYSLHNYYPFCPQVNLWKQERCSCEGAGDGKECVYCVPAGGGQGGAGISRVVKSYLDKAGYPSGSLIRDFSYRVKKAVVDNKKKQTDSDHGFARLSCPLDKDMFAAFVRKNTEYLNQYADVILAVSERVKSIAVRNGLDASGIITEYIGTKFAAEQEAHCRCDIHSTPFRMICLGYARRDKGFWFLLDALKMMPDEAAAQIELCFAVKSDEAKSKQVENLIAGLAGKYRAVYYKNGYEHKELRDLTDGVHLGLVTPLWEDNLPQVAMELVAMGVPILTSDRGGAQELGNDPAFVYHAEDGKDFVGHVIRIMHDRELLAGFFDHCRRLVSAEDHTQRLLSLYAGGAVSS